MMGKFILILIMSLVYLVMMGIMLIFERDKPRNMIIYTILFLFTQVIGYSIYLISRIVSHKKKSSLETKKIEDEIYANLSSKFITDNNVVLNDELLMFNNVAFNSKTTNENNCEFFSSYNKFKESLCQEIKKAQKFILLELSKINLQDFEDIKSLLIKKSLEGLTVKCVIDKSIPLRLKRDFKKNGIKICRFSKFNTLGKTYSNIRNIIVIDGAIAYIGNFDINKAIISNQFDVCGTYVKLKGQIIQDINLAIHKDIIFSSGKYIEYSSLDKFETTNKLTMQYVVNDIDKDLELLIIKAISMAKSSIQLQLDEFIPTESIMSLLNFAISSHIEVKLMVPIKTNKKSKYYASRAYAKELALLGASVYLYDGFITTNSIVIDDNYVLYGSYVLDREHIKTNLQNILIYKDEKAVNFFNKIFVEAVKNSYKISDAKYMLLKEKFFKNFV